MSLALFFTSFTTSPADASAGRADRELRAVNRALNFTQGKRHASWRDYLEWLDFSVESAMRHVVKL